MKTLHRMGATYVWIEGLFNTITGHWISWKRNSSANAKEKRSQSILLVIPFDTHEIYVKYRCAICTIVGIA